MARLGRAGGSVLELNVKRRKREQVASGRGYHKQTATAARQEAINPVYLGRNSDADRCSRERTDPKSLHGDELWSF